MWDQLFKEVRTKRNLSYAPAPAMRVYQGGAVGMVSVSAVDPTTTYKVMLDELRRMQTTPLTPEALAGAKATYLTGLVNDSEATDGQANLLAIGELYAGDWRFARTSSTRCARSAPPTCRPSRRSTFVNLQTVMLGDPAKLDPALGKDL
jgi:predicted Zn-dependent peptidase